MNTWIAILDFGSQYTHLIARRVRECGVYSEIVPYNIRAEKLKKRNPRAIIISGGPSSVLKPKSPLCDKKIFNLGIPVLGICYGAQLMTKFLNGRIEKADEREYGHAILRTQSTKDLFKGLSKNESIWMSHGDRIAKLPSHFHVIGKTSNSPVAAMAHKTKPLYAVQFHPEVVHTKNGKKILSNFIYNISKCKRDWNMGSFIDDTIESVRENIGKDKVLCGVSGGVDSSVLAFLLHKAIGKQLVSVFVDNGLLRKDEAKIIREKFKESGHINLRIVKAEKLFLRALKGVVDPEKKRKIIGNLFIKVFESEVKKLGIIKYLAQGTLYPDVIESVSPLGGPSATIKTHHNVGGLPKRLRFKLVEPFRELFKDEVRVIGKKLKVPDEIVMRQPFPGPGLAIRVIGEVTKKRLDVLRQADWILIDEIKKARLYRKLWQSFCVILPVQTVGVMGDERTYENVIAVRAVTSEDAMTARWAELPYKLLANISSRIVNEVKGVNRVVYDISSKPPGTIEWE